MKINFHKYQATGNDFVIIDNRYLKNNFSTETVKTLCHRNFGIGADGLILFQIKDGFDFEMVYYNSDGKPSTMCGNGGRSITKFAHNNGIIKSKYNFIANDGAHISEINTDGIVALKMKDIDSVKKIADETSKENAFVLNTGSPHFVKLVSEVKNMDVVELGRKIRNTAAFKQEGINVNFVERLDDNTIFVRTYERGVENETLSCGTGVTASAIVCFHNEIGFNSIDVKTLGGQLTVEYNKLSDNVYKDVWLKGAAECVFEGSIEIPD